MKSSKNSKLIFDIIWIVLMLVMCVIDIYNLSVGWNIFSFISLLLCGISLAITLGKIVYDKHFKGENQ